MMRIKTKRIVQNRYKLYFPIAYNLHVTEQADKPLLPTTDQYIYL